jgi:hypothetical protein
LKLADDKLYQESTGVGGWGITPPPAHPIVTRAKVAPIPKVKDVYLSNLITNELTKVGEANSNDKAMDLVKVSGLVPMGWNTAFVEATEEQIMIACTRGAICSGIDPGPSVTRPKSKPKESSVLPEKLVGKNPDQAFAPRAPNPNVPGVMNLTVDPASFMGAIVRPVTPESGSFRIECDILKGPSKGVILRKDFIPTKLFAALFQDTTSEPHERVKIVLKPLKLENGAKYKIERFSLTSHLALTIHIWDGSERRCEVEVSPNATVA